MKGAAWYPVRRRGFGLARVFQVQHLLGARFDWGILAVALGLLSTGVWLVHGMEQADIDFYRSDVDFQGHLRKLALALPALLLGTLVRPKWLRKNAYGFYAFTLVLLLLVPLIGEERNNARRWIPLPGIGFDLQPSELAKLGLILALARALYQVRLRRFGEWALPAALALVPMALVVKQPDLGTAMTVVPVTLGLLYAAGASARRIGLVVAAAALAALLAFRFELVRDYQLQRVDTWLETLAAEDLIAKKNGPAFHTYHARVAIGNGSVWGTGVGRGVANEAGHLPERDSDSVFAVLAEELGLVGVSIVVLAYSGLILALLVRASTIRERFARLVVGGIALYFAAHFFINTGVNLGLLPMTGLTLPLFSTGGSSLLTSCLCLGIALGLSAQREATLDGDAFRE
jgi:rod shape determining protein RodA